MNKRIGILGTALFVFLGLPAMAEEFQFSDDKPAVSNTVSRSETPELHVTAGAGLAFYSGDFAQLYPGGRVGWAVNASALRRISDSSFYLGMDFGLNFWDFDSVSGTTAGSDFKRNSIGIQLLPSFVYRFAGVSDFNVTPYLGFSFGPNIYLHRQRYVDLTRNEVVSNTETKLYLELLVRPGLDIHLTETVGLNTEMKFGLLNNDFIFLPQLNALVTL